MELLERGDLQDVDIRRIDIPAAVDSFDDYWSPFLGGTGSAPKYCVSLDKEARERLKMGYSGNFPSA